MKPNTELTAVDPIERWVAITGEEPIRELSQVPPAMVAELIAVFAPHAQAVRQLAAMAKGVCVTDENDAAGMAEARRLRLGIRKVRLAAEDDRKEQKAWAVIAGRVCKIDAPCTSAEYLAKWIYDTLRESLPELHQVFVYETAKTLVAYPC